MLNARFPGPHDSLRSSIRLLKTESQQIPETQELSKQALNKTKTIHDLFAWVASPTKVTVTDFLVKWGHLLIGLSLVSGLLTRAGAFFGATLMVIYYIAHMDFPYVENQNNFIVDYHLIYVGVLILLIITPVGHVFGLDRWVSHTRIVHRHQFLKWLIGSRSSFSDSSR